MSNSSYARAYFRGLNIKQEIPTTNDLCSGSYVSVLSGLPILYRSQTPEIAISKFSYLMPVIDFMRTVLSNFDNVV